MQFCSPIPNANGVPTGIGAVCDNFLSKNQLILDEQQWLDLQSSWIAKGQTVECTTSQTLADIKSEVEKLCSLVSCDYEIQKKVISGLKKLQKMGNQKNLNRRM